MLLGVVAFVGLAAWVGSSDWVGRVLVDAAPLVGRWDPTWTPRIWLPASLAGVLVVFLPWAAARLEFRRLVAVAWAASAAFTVALAGVPGRAAISAPLGTGYEYRVVLGDIERRGVGDFVANFVTDLPTYPTHVRGHPVGAPLVFWVPERLGLVGVEWSAALTILVAASAVVSVSLTVRRLVHEDAARRALPFLVLLPAVVWVGTSMDGLFAGVVAASIALFAAAVDGHARRHDLAAVAGGVVGALALHLSYGAVVMLVPAVVIVASRRRVRPLVFGAAGAAAVTAGFVGLGFWWFDGLAATRVEYFAGAGGFRPYWYFALLGNLAAVLFALGPAVPVAIARLRDARVWLIVGAALGALLVANVSGMSKGEVERIWLPFVPWVAVATVALPAARVRFWLGLQAGLALVLQLCLVSPW